MRTETCRMMKETQSCQRHPASMRVERESQEHFQTRVVSGACSPGHRLFTPLLPSDVRTRRHRIMGNVGPKTRSVISCCSHLIPETDRTSAEMADTSLTSLSDDLNDRLSLICRNRHTAVSNV